MSVHSNEASSGRGQEPKADVACITFGPPLVGDKALQKLVLYRGWDKRIHQVVWRHDMMPRVLSSPSQLQAMRLACKSNTMG